MAGDAATNVAGLVRPTEEELSQIDKPAEDNTWYEKPEFSKGKFSRESMRERFKGVYRGKPKEDVQGAAKPADKTKGGPRLSTRDKLKQKYEERVSEKDREKFRQRNEDYRRRLRAYYHEKMPEERKKQTIWRLKKMILECQHHPDYSRSVETLLDLAEEYGRYGRSMSEGGTGTLQQTRARLQKAQDDLKTIIERFANGTSTDPLWDSVDSLFEASRHDEELRGWFKNMDSYIRRCLLEEGYIVEDASNRDWDELYERGRYLFRDKYRTNTDRIIDETRFVSEQFDKDPQNKEFGLAVQRLFQHLGNDETGKLVFKPHLVKDLTGVIIPAAIESIEYVPIPRIEYSDPMIDAVVENLIVEADNIFPNLVEVKSSHYFKMGRKKIPNDQHQVFDVRVGGIQMDLRDVNYYIHKKQGFPAIQDTGIVNVFLGGSGLTSEIRVSTAERHDMQRFFKVEKVDVDIRNLKIKLVKSKFKVVFALLQPILVRVMRPVIQKIVEKHIKEQFNKWDAILYDIQQDARHTLEDERARAATEAGFKRSTIYNRYYSSAKKYREHRKEEARLRAREREPIPRKVNIAYTMHDSIFPDIKLPGATSERATKYKDMSMEGEAWESPVFSIGHASHSRDIPRAPKIDKKLGQRKTFEESRRKERQRASQAKMEAQQQAQAQKTGNVVYSQQQGTGAGDTYVQQGQGNIGQQQGTGTTSTTYTNETGIDGGGYQKPVGTVPISSSSTYSGPTVGSGGGSGVAGAGTGTGHTGNGGGVTGGIGYVQQKQGGEFATTTGLKTEPDPTGKQGQQGSLGASQFENGNPAAVRQTAEFPGTGGTTAPLVNPETSRIS